MDGILIADPSAAMRRILEWTLEEAGLPVKQSWGASDGIEALELLNGGAEPALVLTAIAMPRMGGLDFLKRLKLDARWRSLPVVMLTTDATAERGREAQQMGAVDCWRKPVTPDFIASRLSILRSGSWDRARG